MVKQLTAVKQKILVKGEDFWADTQTKTEGSKASSLTMQILYSINIEDVIHAY